MEGLVAKEKNKPKSILSKKVKNYSRAIAFSIATILGSQTGTAFADNLLSDSDVRISKPFKANKETEKYITDFSVILDSLIMESGYKYVENRRGMVEAIREIFKDICKKSGKPCDVKNEIDFLKEQELKIIGFFKNKLPPDKDTVSIILNKNNFSKLLDLFPSIEILLQARYGSNYMDVLNKETIEESKYSIDIVIEKDKLVSMELVEN